MSSVEQLKYKDDVDRRYGVAGMVLAAFILDYEKYISSVSIERSGLEAIEFSPDFFIVSGENYFFFFFFSASASTCFRHSS